MVFPMLTWNLANVSSLERMSFMRGSTTVYIVYLS